jgi:hypothetical protein
LLGEHKHCDYTARNTNSENARIRMEAGSARKHEYGGKGRKSKVLGAFGLPYFSMLRAVLAWSAFWNLRNLYLFNSKMFRVAINRGYWTSGYGVRPIYYGVCIIWILRSDWMYYSILRETRRESTWHAFHWRHARNVANEYYHTYFNWIFVSRLLALRRMFTLHSRVEVADIYHGLDCYFSLFNCQWISIFGLVLTLKSEWNLLLMTFL